MKSIDHSAFYNCDALTSVKVEWPTPISISENAFNTQSNATLYVPAGSKTSYETAECWKDFKEIVEIEKCAKPVITIDGGKLRLTCETEGVTFKTSYQYESGGSEATGNEVCLGGTITYTISVVASKDGYFDSDIATTSVELNVGIKGDTNGDGKVTITDAVGVVNIILNGNTEASAPALEQPAETIEAE